MVECGENINKVTVILCLIGALNQGVIGIGYALSANQSWDFIDYLFIDLIGVVFLADMFYSLVFLSALYLLIHCLFIYKKSKKSKK